MRQGELEGVEGVAHGAAYVHRKPKVPQVVSQVQHLHPLAPWHTELAKLEAVRGLSFPTQLPTSACQFCRHE